MYLDDMMVIANDLDAELSSTIGGILLIILIQVFAPMRAHKCRPVHV